MEKKVMWRGSTNNGVTTVLTQAAAEAAEQLRLLSISPSWELLDEDTRVAVLRKEIARGTFAFCAFDAVGYYAGFCAGTTGDLNEWSRDVQFVGHVGSFVPFSNGMIERERQYVHSPAEIADAFGIEERVVLERWGHYLAASIEHRVAPYSALMQRKAEQARLTSDADWVDEYGNEYYV